LPVLSRLSEVQRYTNPTPTKKMKIVGAPFLARSWREKACPERSRRVGIFDSAK
jgi:hypothetical protein